MWRRTQAYLSRQIGAESEIQRATCNLILRAQEQVTGWKEAPQVRRNSKAAR